MSGSKFFRIPFFHKHTAFTSYHIEQDTKTCIISLYMRIACPILRSQTPEFLLMLSCIKLWRTVVLCIQQNDINPQFRLLLIDQTSYFHIKLLPHWHHHLHPKSEFYGSSRQDRYQPMGVYPNVQTKRFVFLLSGL